MFRKLLFVLGGFAFGLKWNKGIDMRHVYDMELDFRIMPFTGTLSQFRKELEKVIPDKGYVDQLIDEVEDGDYYVCMFYPSANGAAVDNLVDCEFVADGYDAHPTNPRQWMEDAKQWRLLPIKRVTECRNCGQRREDAPKILIDANPRLAVTVSKGQECWNCGYPYPPIRPIQIDEDALQRQVKEAA